MKLGEKIQSTPMRTFSESFKKEQVLLIEQGKASVLQISRAYKVSTTAVYKWLKKYARSDQKRIRQVVELKSEAARTLALQKKTEELERVIGQKQLQIDYLEKLIELAGKELGKDIKKALAGKLSDGLKHKGK